ncbi:hypothetical protein ABIB73_004723 [Bradyrhizobium sp. F1.4.3]
MTRGCRSAVIDATSRVPDALQRATLLRCVRGTRATFDAHSRHVVIASAAKQSRVFPQRNSGLLRCARNDGARGGIAILQNTSQLADTPSHPRGSIRPSFASSLHPLIQEGAGKAGCRLAPAVRCAKAHAEKLHSGIQVKPNTRPSLRSGLTAYAALSREPSSFWPPSPPRNSRTPRRLTRMSPPQELDRSNDGQDHTVLPYARSLVRHRARRRGAHSHRDIGETNYQRRSSA